MWNHASHAWQHSSMTHFYMWLTSVRSALVNCKQKYEWCGTLRRVCSVRLVSEKLSSHSVRFHKYRCNSVFWTCTISSPFSLSAYVNWSQIKGMHSPARTARQGLVALHLRLSSTVHFAVSIHDDIRWSWIEHSRIWQAVLFFYCKWVYLTSIVNSCGRFRSDIRCMQINTVEWYWSTEIKTKQLSASKKF